MSRIEREPSVLNHVASNIQIKVRSAVAPPGPRRELEAGGKPSTWLPPGRLVEHSTNLNDDSASLSMDFGLRALTMTHREWILASGH